MQDEDFKNKDNAEKDAAEKLNAPTDKQNKPAQAPDDLDHFQDFTIMDDMPDVQADDLYNPNAKVKRGEGFIKPPPKTRIGAKCMSAGWI